MQSFYPETLPTSEVYKLMIGAIAPRPIAFVSTLGADGTPNLAPYSYFNAFSSKPAVVAFSSNLRTNNLSEKDTLLNVKQQGEVVINMVNYAIVRQMAITSVAFPQQVSEFKKAGLTPIASTLVSPFRVKESPIQMECRVQQIISLGKEGGSGNMVLCKVLAIHVNEEVLDDNGRINPHKLDLMGRLGRSYYVRASGDAVHTIYQPSSKVSIGYDNLPASAKNSHFLTANDLGQLAGIYAIPTPKSVQEHQAKAPIQQVLNSENPIKGLHQMAQKELRKEHRELAAELIWLAEKIATTG